MAEEISGAQEAPRAAASGIVAGGGWVRCRVSTQPRMNFFLGLSVVWIGVSLFASMPFWDGWPETFGFSEWLGLAGLILHPILLSAAVFLFFTETPKDRTVWMPNPEHDLHKLY
jgi:hypothetical protein